MRSFGICIKQVGAPSSGCRFLPLRAEVQRHQIPNLGPKHCMGITPPARQSPRHPPNPLVLPPLRFSSAFLQDYLFVGRV